MDMQFCAQTGYGPVFNFQQGQPAGMAYTDGQYAVHPAYSGLQYMYPYQQHRNHLLAERASLHDGKADSKPRLSKEEVDKLEKVFQENPKPSSSTKAQLADSLGLERPRINNWFQNRRAKAKQERKQEEYEARRAAETSTSDEPDSPELDHQSSSSDLAGDSGRSRVQPSSAMFPDVSSSTASSENNWDDSNSGAPDCGLSPRTHDNAADAFQSPLSLDFSQADAPAFPRRQEKMPVGCHDEAYAPFISPKSNVDQISDMDDHESVSEQSGDLGTIMEQTVSPVSQMAFYQQARAMDTDPKTALSTPTADSFKSPPPPADIASRRNIRRPAALNVGSRNFSMGNVNCGPMTSIDGSRRMDPSSPASVRRIASATGPLTGPLSGRIQKNSTGPRSPFFARNAETLLQYHARSPMGPVTSPLGAPPTPMTPAVMNSHSREPAVSSAYSGEEGHAFGTGLSSNIMQELKADHSIKTPPDTPGMMNHMAYSNSFVPYSATSMDFPDQPLLTPYFQSEFPQELSANNHMPPSYLELNDSSLPNTPMYPNMPSSSMQDPNMYPGNKAGGSNTQFDWDANEPITMSSNTPEDPSGSIHFTQNMTPQDYTP